MENRVGKSIWKAHEQGLWNFNIDPLDESWRDRGIPELGLEQIDFRFDRETLFELVAMTDALGRGFEDTLGHSLETLASAYLAAKAERASAPKQPEITRRLMKLIKKTDGLIEELEGLDNPVLETFGPAYDEVEAELRRGFSKNGKIDPLKRELWAFRETVAEARSALAKRRGPGKDRALAYAVHDLVSFYEDNTGELATHSASKDSVYEGTPQSAAGAFVRLFFSEVDLKLPETRLSSALAEEIRLLREEREMPPAPRRFVVGRFPSISQPNPGDSRSFGVF